MLSLINIILSKLILLKNMIIIVLKIENISKSYDIILYPNDSNKNIFDINFQYIQYWNCNASQTKFLKHIWKMHKAT